MLIDIQVHFSIKDACRKGVSKLRCKCVYYPTPDSMFFTEIDSSSVFHRQHAFGSSTIPWALS